MNLLAVLHAVRDPAGFVVNRKAQRIFINREQYILNPADRNALELALRLAGAGGQVTAFSVGGDEAHDALQQARALGARRAILAHGDELRAARGDGQVLAAVLKRLVGYVGNVDAVLLGDEVIDADLAQAGPRLAAALGWPFAQAVHSAEQTESGRLRVIARAPGGEPGPAKYHQVDVPLPAVIAAARDSNKPRYAAAAALVNTYRARDAVENVTAEQLGLAGDDLQPSVQVRGESFPAEREFGRRVEGSPGDIARQLAGVLRKS